MVQTEYHHSGLHQQKSKVQMKLWSDSQKQSAVILKITRSAKHHSVCTSGGCQQLTDDRSVMKLCFAPAGWQLTVDGLSDFTRFPWIFWIYFLGQLPGSPSAAGSCSYQTPAPHINIFQKVRTKKIWVWSELATNPEFWMLDSLFPGVSLSWSILASIEFLSKAMQRPLAGNAAWKYLPKGENQEDMGLIWNSNLQQIPDNVLDARFFSDLPGAYFHCHEAYSQKPAVIHRVP